jgi:uncharacterized protein DUF1616
MAAASPTSPAQGGSPTPRRRVTREGLAVAVLAIVCSLVAWLVDASAPRIAAALILTLAAPGYALSSLVFPSRRLDCAERVLTALGMSLVVAALGGLLLDVLSGHMSRGAWALMLALVTLCATLAGALRPPPPDDLQTGPVDGDADVSPSADGWYSGHARVALNLALGVSALALAAGALTMAVRSAERHAGFAELSVLPASQGREPRLLVKLESHELHPTPFTIVIREDRRVPLVSHITLTPGADWHILTTPLRLSTRALRADAFRLGSSTPLLSTVYYPAGPREVSTPVLRRTATRRKRPSASSKSSPSLSRRARAGRASS